MAAESKGGFWRRLTGLFLGAPAPPTEQPIDRPEPRPAGAGAWKLRYGFLSIVGDYREHNEDNFHIPSLSKTPQHTAGQGGGGSCDTTLDLDPARPETSEKLFIVADGMGGQNAGEQASKMAVEIIPQELIRRLPKEPGIDSERIAKAVKDAMAEANKDILALSLIQSEYNNMGTTAVVCLFRDDKAFVAGLGDSRVYRCRKGELRQLTKDHSLADALVDAGTISAAEVENHRFKHVLYLYLGSKEARSGPDDVSVVDIQVGDRFLLASDGLTGVVRDFEIGSILASVEDPQTAAQELVERARKNESRDNITCIVIHVDEPK